jgi:tellurium resistance protein TerZ
VGVSLTKGQTVSLVKGGAGGAGLSRVRMGLGWDAVPKKGLFRVKARAIDLDASALLFDAGGQLVDEVWFGQLQSKDGSVVHTGDNRTGEGDGDDESIKVNLAKVPANVSTLVFTVNSFTGQDFTHIQNAFCRLIDEKDESEIARYDLTGSGPHTAQIMAKVSRTDGGWSMTAMGIIASGRTFHDLLPAIAGQL